MRKGASKSQMTVYYVVPGRRGRDRGRDRRHRPGEDKKAQPSIAGGYDLQAPNDCFGTPPAPAAGKPLPATAPPQAAAAGPSFDVKQSGQFVNLSNTQGTLAGKLRLEEHANGRRLPPARRRRLVRQRGDPGVQGVCHAGRQGHDRRHARRRRDRRRPEARSARSPARRSRALPARSRASTTCRRAPPASAAGSSSRAAARPTRSSPAETSSATLAYDKEKGAVTGDVECTKGGEVRAKATAVDRNLNNFQLIPLDEAEPTGKTDASGKPLVSTPSGLPPSGERFTATRQRESFGHLVAAFFIAVAIVMLVARLFGTLAVKIASAARHGRGRGRHHARPDDPRLRSRPASRRRYSRPTSSPRSASRPTSD